MASNEAPGIGDNSGEIDYAREETERLGRDYSELNKNIEELLAEAREIPAEINDAETKTKAGSLVKRLRDAVKRAEGFHGLEKQPFLRRGQGVDQFFFGIIDKLSRRSKTNRAGAADILLARITDYDNRELAKEQERRRLEWEESERKRIAAEKKAQEEAAEAEQRRLEAERARKPETQAAKEEVAKAAEEQASAAVVDATVAAQQAEEKYVETLARPADIMRTRTDDGTLMGMQREAYAEIEDASKLDAAALWAHVSFAEKEKALRAWAKSTGHTVMMTGAKIGFRNKSRVR